MDPYFFQENLFLSPGIQVLDETTSKHCIQVLRMKTGDRIRLTDGAGHLAMAEIASAEKKHCSVSISQIITHSFPEQSGFSIGIAFTKNKSRNEWLLEKLTEMGTENIFPIITEHSEREKFNQERYEKILVSALLQSQQTRLPKLFPTQKLPQFLEYSHKIFQGQKFIAHCQEGDNEKKAFSASLTKDKKCLMLIGPEGDFSSEEIQACFRHQFIPVHLGENRLRTETAGMYSCAVYNAFQNVTV